MPEGPPLEGLDFERRGPRSGYDPGAAVGPLRAWFRRRPERFADFRARCRAARLDAAYDAYLARSVRLAVGGAAVGILLGLAVAIAVGAGAAVAAAATLGGIALGGAVVLGARAAYPRLRARRRARAIDGALPHATVFLFALGQSGTDLVEIVDRLAEEDDVYGPLSGAFAAIAWDAERFGADLFSAIERARAETPSDQLGTFLDELVGVLETGGDVEAFLHDQIESHRARAERLQEQFVSDVETLAEVYVSVVFAGPAFLLVVLVVMSLALPAATTALSALVYLGIPGVLVAFYLLFAGSVGAYVHERRRIDLGEPAPAPPDDDRVEAYRAAKPGAAARLAGDPLAAVRARPVRALAFSVPAALLAAGALVAVGYVPVAPAAMAAAPVPATIGLAVVPFLVAGAPVAALHVRRRRRARRVRDAFPGALETMADGARNDLPMTDTFDLVARRLSDPLGAEFGRLRDDVTWTGDARGALVRFADRVESPSVTRAVALLVESVHDAGSLGPIYEAVADDLRRRNELRSERRTAMRPYLVVVAVGVLVFLAIVAVFETYFLPVAERAPDWRAAAAGAQLPTTEVSIDRYRRLFFHAALLQAAGNGLVAGELLEDRLASGLPYALGLVAVVTLAFLGLA